LKSGENAPPFNTFRESPLLRRDISLLSHQQKSCTRSLSCPSPFTRSFRRNFFGRPFSPYTLQWAFTPFFYRKPARGIFLPFVFREVALTCSDWFAHFQSSYRSTLFSSPFSPDLDKLSNRRFCVSNLYHHGLFPPPPVVLLLPVLRDLLAPWFCLLKTRLNVSFLTSPFFFSTPFQRNPSRRETWLLDCFCFLPDIGLPFHFFPLKSVAFKRFPCLFLRTLHSSTPGILRMILSFCFLLCSRNCFGIGEVSRPIV